MLSLFGKIPTQEIRDLALKCEKFMVNFLEDRQDKKDGDGNGEEDGQGNN